MDMIPEDYIPSDFWGKLEAVLRECPLIDYDEACSRQDGASSYAGFNLAQLTIGLLIENGVYPHSINLIPFGRQVSELIPEGDATEIVTAMIHQWKRVFAPKGIDPVEYAVLRARHDTDRPPGEYLTLLQCERAALVWNTLRYLPKNKSGKVFVTNRKLADALDLKKDCVNTTIWALVENGAISVAEKGREGSATRYIVHGEQQYTSDTDR